MNEQLAAERQQQSLTALQSPMELDAPLRMRRAETVTIADYGIDDKGYFDTKYSMPDGGIIEGAPSLSIKIGGDIDFATIQVLDLTHNPMGEFGDEYLRQTGKGQNGEPISSRGNFAILLTDKSGKPVEFHPLERRGTWNIGRNGIGRDWLPDTVSREHLTIGIDEDGKLQVENHEPTNDTTISKPEKLQAPENRYRTEHIDIDRAGTLDLANIEPLAGEVETTDKLGVVGVIVGNIKLDNGEVDAVIVKRKMIDDKLGFSLVQKKGDGPFEVTLIEPDKETTLQNEKGYKGSSEVGITIDQAGKLTMKQKKAQYRHTGDDASSNKIIAKREVAIYSNVDPDLPNRPVKDEPEDDPYGHQILADGHVVRGLIVPGRNEVMTSQGIVRTRETPRLG